MKRIILIFVTMLSLFVGIWVVKAKAPINRPDAYQDGAGYSAGAWWIPDNNDVSPEWVLDPEIPDNYLPIPGEDELYMIIDNNGHILGYRKRTKQEDGSWIWQDVNPDIPSNYEAVDGLDNVYKVTDSEGKITYMKYIRNEDDTFAFVPVDEKGVYLNGEAPNGDEIPDNYRRITGNIYAILNEHGVVIGYKERRLNADGSFNWIDCEKPVIKENGIRNNSYNSNANAETQDPTSTPNLTTQIPKPTESTTIPGNEDSNGTVVQQQDGTYVQTETLITSETAGGWTTTYETIIIRKYSERGILLSTKKDGPKEISKVKTVDSSPNAPDPNKVASTLSAELARVTVGLNFKPDLSQAVLDELNAERIAEGLPALRLDSSGDAYKLAQIRAADMAIYHHSDFDSPTYGTLADMMNRFGIKSAIPSENTWKATTSKNAGAIHARFMVLDNAREALLNKAYTKIGIAIVQKSGYFYISEILIN